MNSKWILQDLNEAKEQLVDIIGKLSSQDYNVDDFELDMTHVYSHLNVAYNTRSWSEEQINQFDDEKYKKVRKTPTDLIFINN